jgi:hypothetical protein
VVDVFVPEQFKSELSKDAFKLENIKIIAKNLPLRLTEEIIANSDFPVIVTGDVSLSFALEHRIPFAYEYPGPWKRGLVADLKKFMPGLAVIGNEHGPSELAKIFSREYADTLFSRFDLDREKLSLPKKILSVLQKVKASTTFQFSSEDFRTGIEDLATYECSAFFGKRHLRFE